MPPKTAVATVVERIASFPSRPLHRHVLIFHLFSPLSRLSAPKTMSSFDERYEEEREKDRQTRISAGINNGTIPPDFSVTSSLPSKPNLDSRVVVMHQCPDVVTLQRFRPGKRGDFIVVEQGRKYPIPDARELSLEHKWTRT